MQVQRSSLLKVRLLIVLASLDDIDEVRRQDERAPLSPNSPLALEVPEDVAKVNVEKLWWGMDRYWSQLVMMTFVRIDRLNERLVG